MAKFIKFLFAVLVAAIVVALIDGIVHSRAIINFFAEANQKFEGPFKYVVFSFWGLYLLLLPVAFLLVCEVPVYNKFGRNRFVRIANYMRNSFTGFVVVTILGAMIHLFVLNGFANIACSLSL